jgi:hypothetical protein
MSPEHKVAEAVEKPPPQFLSTSETDSRYVDRLRSWGILGFGTIAYLTILFVSVLYTWVFCLFVCFFLFLINCVNRISNLLLLKEDKKSYCSQTSYFHKV